VRRGDRTYIYKDDIEGYGEVPVTKVYHLYMGGRDLIVTFPRSRKAVARFLVEQLNCGHGERI